MGSKIGVGKDTKILKAIKEIDRSIEEWEEIYSSDDTDKSLCLGINMLKGFRQKLVNIRDDKPIKILTYNTENREYQEKGSKYNG